MIFCPECLLLGWRLKYKNNSFAKTWSYFTTEVEILIKMVPKMCRKIMEREREDDRRYFHEIERDFWEQEQQKKGNEDPGGKINVALLLVKEFLSSQDIKNIA